MRLRKAYPENPPTSVVGSMSVAHSKRYFELRYLHLIQLRMPTLQCTLVFLALSKIHNVCVRCARALRFMQLHEKAGHWSCLSYVLYLRHPDRMNLIFVASSAYTSILESLSASTVIERDCFGDSFSLRSNEEPTCRTPAEYSVSRLVFSIKILHIELIGRLCELRSRRLQTPFCREPNPIPSYQSQSHLYQPDV